MIIFNDKIELRDEIAHWYIDNAELEDINVFDFFETVLDEYFYFHKGDD